MEITSFVEAATIAPINSSPKPICATDEPANFHLPFTASANTRILARIQNKEEKVINMKMRFVYVLVM
ncbi:hypothetical protein D3C87_2153520 [compost metagenome]